MNDTVEIGEYKGFRYMIRKIGWRTKLSKDDPYDEWWHTAYVEIPDKLYEDPEESIVCHGGVTYMESYWPAPYTGEDNSPLEGHTIIGWDYNHYMDNGVPLDVVKQDVLDVIDRIQKDQVNPWQRVKLTGHILCFKENDPACEVALAERNLYVKEYQYFMGLWLNLGNGPDAKEIGKITEGDGIMVTSEDKVLIIRHYADTIPCSTCDCRDLCRDHPQNPCLKDDED